QAAHHLAERWRRVGAEGRGDAVAEVLRRRLLRDLVEVLVDTVVRRACRIGVLLEDVEDSHGASLVWMRRCRGGDIQRRAAKGSTGSPFHQRFSGPRRKTAKCRCGASARALPVLPT